MKTDPNKEALVPPPMPSGSMDALVTKKVDLHEELPPLPIPPPFPHSEQLGALKSILGAKGMQKSWVDEVFNEDYWRFSLPSAKLHEKKEIDFIESSLVLKSGQRVLDLACGDGKHALQLAERGYQLVALDRSLAMLNQALLNTQKQKNTPVFTQLDMREITYTSEFDAAYSISTSFGYFSDEVNRQVLYKIFRALKPGGRLLLDVLNRDQVLSTIPTRVWWQGNGCVVLEEVDFLSESSQLRVQRQVAFDDKRQQKYEIMLRIYSLHEILQILRQVGFRIEEISGDIASRGHFFGADSKQILVLASKP